MRRARLLVRKRNGEQRPKETKLRLGYADQVLAAVATPLNNKLAVVGNDGSRALPGRLRCLLPAAHASSWRLEENAMCLLQISTLIDSVLDPLAT